MRSAFLAVGVSLKNGSKESIFEEVDGFGGNLVLMENHVLSSFTQIIFALTGWKPSGVIRRTLSGFSRRSKSNAARYATEAACWLPTPASVNELLPFRSNQPLERHRIKL